MAASAAQTAGVDRYKGSGWWTRVRLHPAGPVAIMFLGALTGCVIAGLLIPDRFVFLSEANLTLLLRAVPNFGMVALGVGLLLIAGEFDLSVGAVYGVAAFFMAYAYRYGVPLPLAILLALGIGAMVGLFNGLITLRFRIPSFITTLGTLFIVRTSAPYIVGGAQAITFKPPEAFTKILTGPVGPIPAQFLWFIGFAAIAYLILNRHYLGNHIFAAGGNRNAAKFAGINVFWTKLIAFMVCSIFAAIAGIFAATRLSTAKTEPQLFIELFAVAICVIGGISLFGGRGSVIGIVLGAAVLQLVQDVIILARLPGFYLDMFVGIMIVVGVVINQMVRRKF